MVMESYEGIGVSERGNYGICLLNENIAVEISMFVCSIFQGGDLDQKITSYKKQGKRFSESQIIEWTIQLLMAVQHMHSR